MKVTVILPVHKYEDCVETAIASYKNLACLEDCKLIVATTKEIADSHKFDVENITYLTVEDGESTSFQHLVNKAVDTVDTEYFSILEMDDVYSKNAVKAFENYFNSGFDASVYLPLTIVYDYNAKYNVGYMNEAVLANSFSEENGYLDIDSTIDSPIFNFTGGIFNTKDFIECGKLKESMRVHFWHEFSLRMLHEGKKIFVLPKVGYTHTVSRPDSLYTVLDKEMSGKEADFWFDLAKKEYFFKTDRNKIYEE